MAHDETLKAYYSRRKSEMTIERESFISHYQDLSEFLQPRRGRFLASDRNRGGKRHRSIINSTGSMALRVAQSGMFAGTVSPSRPWFAYETPDPELMEFAPVKNWLYDTELVIRRIFNQSNFYGMTPVMIGEMLGFAQGCMTHEDDFDDVARFYTHTVGSYMIEQNDKFRVDTLCREYEWQVGQLVKAYGLNSVSQQVKNAYDKGNYGQWYPVVHFIEPNPDFERGSSFGRRKAFRSVYFEPGQELDDKFLRRSGFDMFPAYCPRWDVTGEDIYGTDCPGMTGLGDVKGLQIEEKRKAQGIDKMVNPPLQGTAQFRNVPVSSLPGGLNIHNGEDNKQGLAPIYQIDLRLNELRADIDSVEKRIERAFYVDLFQAISRMEGIQPRNEFDLAQRNEERLLQLGPVLERYNGEFLDPLHERAFDQAVKAGILRPAPLELQGVPLKVNYISTLAMAMRAVATTGIDRVTGHVERLVGMGYTDVLDKYDADQSVDEYAKAVGVTPRIVVPDEIVEQRRAQRQQQQQVEQIAALAQSAATTANQASGANLEGENALTALVGGR